MTDKDPPNPKKRALNFAIRAIVLAAVAFWIFKGTQLDALAQAIARLSPGIGVLALGIGLMNMGLAGLRWRVLMSAFGAARRPPVWLLVRLFLVGQFYNTFVPGSVGGDVIRGYVSRLCFKEAASSYIVVVSERLIGLSALGFVFLLGYVNEPDILPVENVLPWALGLFGLLLVLFVSGKLGQRISNWWDQIPRLHSPHDLLKAFLISLVGHSATVIIFILFAQAIAPQLTWSVLSLIVPLALIASIIPIAVVGIGPREAALVGLLSLVNIPKHDARTVVMLRCTHHNDCNAGWLHSARRGFKAHSFDC